MTKETYNGWTNYETWRVRLELCDYDGASDNDLDAYDLGQNLRESITELMYHEANGFALDYALAFLSEVNWYEIAEYMIEAYRPQKVDA